MHLLIIQVPDCLCTHGKRSSDLIFSSTWSLFANRIRFLQLHIHRSTTIQMALKPLSRPFWCEENIRQFWKSRTVYNLFPDSPSQLQTFLHKPSILGHLKKQWSASSRHPSQNKQFAFCTWTPLWSRLLLKGKPLRKSRHINTLTFIGTRDDHLHRACRLKFGPNPRWMNEDIFLTEKMPLASCFQTQRSFPPFEKTEFERKSSKFFKSSRALPRISVLQFQEPSHCWCKNCQRSLKEASLFASLANNLGNLFLKVSPPPTHLSMKN